MRSCRMAARSISLNLFSESILVSLVRPERYGLDVGERHGGHELLSVLVGLLPGVEDIGTEFASVSATCSDDVGIVLSPKDEGDNLVDGGGVHVNY